MTPHLSWFDIILRLGLTLLAGVAIGLDRDQHAHPAGLRTTVLIAMAGNFIQGRRGRLAVTFADAGPNEALLLGILQAHRFELRTRQVERARGGATSVIPARVLRDSRAPNFVMAGAGPMSIKIARTAPPPFSSWPGQARP